MYTVAYTDSTKDPITIADRTLNKATSVTFVGKNYTGYGTVVADNFLHLLENFANDTAPGIAPGLIGPPVTGQLWFDTSTTQLKINIDGSITGWRPTSGYTKDITAPINKTVGDLWVDTANQQLYVYSGIGWLLVGPQFKQGSVSGITVDSIVDNDNKSHEVVHIKTNNISMMIINDAAEFTPKSALAGYRSIRRGISISSDYQIYGTTDNAVSLNNVLFSKYARADLDQQFDRTVTILDTLNLGTNRSLQLLTSGTNSTIGSAIPLVLAVNKIPALTIAVNGFIAIGKEVPQTALDLVGVLTIAPDAAGHGNLNITSTAAASISTAGGIIIGASLAVSNNISVADGYLYVGKKDNTSTATVKPALPGPIILPDADITYDIGQVVDGQGVNLKRFRNVYAYNFSGTEFTGNRFIGTFLGTATSISPSGIGSQTAVTDTQLTDEFLIYRASNGVYPAALYKTTKADTLAPLIGTIILFAGVTLPAGYVLCNGATLSKVTYAALWRVFGSPSIFIAPLIPAISTINYIIYTGVVA
jgi:Phage Tail Collar Domain